MLSLNGQMFFISVKSDFSIFFFCCWCFWYPSKNPLPKLKSERFTPMFSSNSSIPLAPIFRWLTHVFLLFLLIYGVRQEFRTGFFSWSYPGVPALFVQETVVSLSNGHGTFVKNQFDVDVWIHFYTFNSVPWVFMFIFMPVPLYFDCCSFTVSFEIRKYESSRFVLFTISFSHLGPLLVSYNGILSFGLCHKSYLNFDRNCTESVDHFEEYWHSNSIKSCILWTGNSL